LLCGAGILTAANTHRHKCGKAGSLFFYSLLFGAKMEQREGMRLPGKQVSKEVAQFTLPPFIHYQSSKKKRRKTRKKQ
jgi:hypothetical protein